MMPRPIIIVELLTEKKSDFDCAIADYTKAIDLKPDFAEAYYNRGEARLYLQEWEDAQSDLTVARDKEINIIAAFMVVMQVSWTLSGEMELNYRQASPQC